VDTLELPNHRVPLGALREGGHQLLSVGLGEGDLMVAYSDGLVEAQSPEGEFFGEDRLLAHLETAPADPDAAMGYLLEQIEAFTRGHKQYDDVTLLVASWSPTGNTA
jgi:sigma-B regulation protein RsbU (phosphoserine phosphatase)